jgi:hypothetical protein
MTTTQWSGARGSDIVLGMSQINDCAQLCRECGQVEGSRRGEQQRHNPETWRIAASAGDYNAIHALRLSFEEGIVSRESIDSTLTAYNDSCAYMRSQARVACIRDIIET